MISRTLPIPHKMFRVFDFIVHLKNTQIAYTNYKPHHSHFIQKKYRQPDQCMEIVDWCDNSRQHMESRKYSGMLKWWAILETIWKQKQAEALSATACFCLLLMAEKERFELSVLSYTRVPGVHLKPLGHLSVMAFHSACQTLSHDKRGSLSSLSADFLQQKINGGSEKTPEAVGCTPLRKHRGSLQNHD